MTSPTTAAAPLAGARSDGVGRILIVDDRPDKLLTLDAALAPLQHEIVKAGSGSEALRALLQHDFAVVLLDMNMPGMDGFETARLIRLRRRNRDTPIIFITAYGDDIHAMQGYMLGAVDFILSPFVPEVLRSKVNVFLELYERTREVREQARRLLRRTHELQGLTRASLQIHAALSIEETLKIAADSAREVIATRRACAVVAANQNGLREHRLVVSPARQDAPASGVTLNPELQQFVGRLSKVARLSADELASPSLRRLFPVAPLAAAGLAAPLIGRDGTNMGLLIVEGKREGEFSDDDDALLVQLAQMTATAVENTLFAEARESNRIKDEFLATLSHELRTPLSSILGWAQLLRTQMLDPDETAEALEIIERNSEMQCKLIEDLLDISRIVTGKMQLHLRPVSLSAVIQAAANVILPSAQVKRIDINVLLDENADCIIGDADRLQQVFWNLLSNAVKFTPAEGAVHVSLEAVDGRARIFVKDNGEGISPEFLPHVFDRFRQADSTTSRLHGGLGIGLAIVRHVIELHGGAVRVESEGKGQGTSFFVTLPLTRVETGARRPPTSAVMDRELQEMLAGPDSEQARLNCSDQ